MFIFEAEVSTCVNVGISTILGERGFEINLKLCPLGTEI